MERLLAEKLLEINAVSLSPEQPYTWSSGIISPIYCDNRITLGYPALRKEIANGLARLIETNFSEVDVVAGTATAGIPHAAWVSDYLDLPMCYVRSSAKGHGKGKRIEGKAEAGNRVVIVEDLISTGKSAIDAAKALQDEGCIVLGIVSIFTYELAEAKQPFAESGIPYYSLSNFSSLIEVAKDKGFISQQAVDYILSWKENPKEWGAIKK
ncbi:orotate phosphoribosyltransferase [Caldibacillus lycopersici]|uniref:Orotate phosphoribosyltransferase n=1 Tax=Perspicuibacillus lycopersici TaxID=1325689 RepID=A0AAE3IR52_9BACI|nr:orotate phosphoribosyltransferase [Perspicuibacillus lycopersici]MCU9612168.1 orotate phosphoribosyltransferase [Perspicuibacillus lycopersici]